MPESRARMARKPPLRSEPQAPTAAPSFFRLSLEASPHLQITMTGFSGFQMVVRDCCRSRLRNSCRPCSSTRNSEEPNKEGVSRCAVFSVPSA